MMHQGQWVWAWVPASAPFPSPPMHGPAMGPFHNAAAMVPFIDPASGGLQFQPAEFEEVLIESGSEADVKDVKEPPSGKPTTNPPNTKDAKDAAGVPMGGGKAESGETLTPAQKLMDGSEKTKPENRKRGFEETKFSIPTAKTRAVPRPPQHVPPRHLVVAQSSRPESSQGWESQSWGNWHSRSWDHEPQCHGRDEHWRREGDQHWKDWQQADQQS